MPSPPTPPTTREARKQATRALLLQTAARLFDELGYEATTMRAIAKAAGMATGSAFVHFESKEALLHAVLHAEIERAVQAAIARPLPELRVLPDAEAPRATATEDALAGARAQIVDDLVGIAAVFIERYAASPQMFVPLLARSLIADAAWADRYRAQVEVVGQRVVAVLTLGKQASALDADLDVRTAALAFFSFYYFGLVMAANERFAHPDRTLAQLRAQLAMLLRASSPPTPGDTP